MKSIQAFIFLLFAFACSGPENTKIDLEQQIAQVENGLVPARQIKGEEVPVHNIEDRLKELGIPGLSLAVA